MVKVQGMMKMPPKTELPTDALPASCRATPTSQRQLSFHIGRDLMHMVDYLSANGLEERSVPGVFFQPRTERTSARPRGPR